MTINVENKEKERESSSMIGRGLAEIPWADIEEIASLAMQ